MKVTARADYAVRAVVELGASDGRLMKADLIAEAQGIPRHFLDNILNDLRRAGIVATQRGAEGGSRLARPADEITLADVMRAMEGPLAAVRDVRPELLEYQGAAESLPEVWLAVRAALRNVLERVTVADVVSGKLPKPVAKLLDDPEAWKPH
ncbi:MAG TPA: Rrf2 family transcriptional regulator [Acidimicrobiia bacterium]|nr:Rrf2 family transcriptional regulator [Acidimicrobiia bacterium]